MPYLKIFLVILFTISLEELNYSQIPVHPLLTSPADSLFTVDSIKVTGNKITEDYVILREITFKSGDLISDKILEFNRERIFSLGLFNDVNVNYTRTGSRVNVIISVNESWYIYPIPFIRFKDRESSKSTYGINLLFRNFRGRDETIRASAAFGYDPSLTLLYNIPILFNSHNFGIGFLFNYTNFENKTEEGIRLNNGDFKYKAIQSRINLNYRINQFEQIIGVLGYDYFEAPEKKFSSITASSERIDRFPIAGFNYIHDSRDLKQSAAEGTYLGLQYFHKGFGLYGINYNIIDTDLRRYLNLTENLTWKARFKARTSIGENIPLYDYSLLGYEDYIRGTSRKRFDGKTYILASMEMSFPVIKEWDMKLKLPLLPESLTSARIGIQFAFFADAGNAFDSYTDFSYRNFTYGWGFGINILLLPYNGFRIEYAFDHNMNGEVLIASGFSF